MKSVRAFLFSDPREKRIIGMFGSYSERRDCKTSENIKIAYKHICLRDMMVLVKADIIHLIPKFRSLYTQIGTSSL